MKTAIYPPGDGKSTTSASAFAGSGFAKLTGSVSGFGALGNSSKPSIFGNSSGSASPFGAAAPKPAAPTLSFGGGDKSGSASPFANINGSSKPTFGSGFGSGFGSAMSGPRLTSFAKPGEVLKSEKPAKPFGAPDSDAESESVSGSDEEGETGEEEAEVEEKEKEQEELKADDKKKTRLQRGQLCCPHTFFVSFLTLN